MATISIADTDARVQYTQAVTANSTTLSITFPFFSLDDIKVVVTNAAGVDNPNGDLTRGTGANTFAVNGTAVDDGFSGGNITLGDTYSDSATKFTIFRDIPVTRTTDFPTSGPFNISALNTELDKLFAIEQELETKIGRTMKLADSDSAATLSLPNLDTRKGTVLAFNATSGLPEAGPDIASVGTVATNVANINTVAGISSNITTVAGIASNVTTVAGIASNVTSVVANASNINAVAADASDIGTVAGDISNVNTVAGISSNISTVAGNTSNINTVAGNNSNISTVAGNNSNVSTVAGLSSEVTAVAGKATEIGRLGTADAVSDMNTLGTSSNVTNMNTLAGIASDITTTAGVASSISASGTNASNAASSATAAAQSATAAAASQTAAAASAASAASAFDSFDDRFLGSKTSNPSTDNDGDALVTGALYFNSAANEMRVYDGANWIAATSAGNVSLILYEYNATANQTTFSGSDTNNATLSYTVGNIQVVLNGVVLDPSDFTATNGTSVVLAAGAAVGDVLNVYAFKSFTTADMVSKSAGGTFSGSVTFAGNVLLGDSSGTDNNRIRLGDSQDFDLFHDGSSSNIRETGTGGLNLRGTAIKIRNVGNSEEMATFTHNGAVELYHDNSKKFETTSTGIAVTGALDVTTSTHANASVFKSTGSTQIMLQDTDATANDQFWGLQVSGGDFNILTCNDDRASGFLTPITIGSTGKVGIGMTPVNQLDVSGNGGGGAVVSRVRNIGGAPGDDATLELAIATASEEMRILFTDSDGQAGQIVVDGGDNTMAFETGTTERMRFHTNGSMRLGTSGDEGFNTGAGNLTMKCTGGDALNINHTVNGNHVVNIKQSGSSTANFFFFFKNGNQVGRIQCSTSSTSYDSLSDVRTKENIEDMTGAIARVKQLKPKRFNFIVDPDQTIDGFLAHEVTSICPHAVSGTPDDVDDDGDPIYQTMDVAKLVPLLTGALQEALAKIETLETKVAALEAGE